MAGGKAAGALSQQNHDGHDPDGPLSYCPGCLPMDGPRVQHARDQIKETPVLTGAVTTLYIMFLMTWFWVTFNLLMISLKNR